ncbi:MAG: rhodanese-like domain-containing protein [Planctomycetota bacterium]
MEWLPLVAALVAIALTVRAAARAAALQSELQDVRRDAQRRVATLEEELRREMEVQRELLAKVAAGESLSKEMIEDGQLWRDIDGGTARELVESSGAFVLDVRTPDETASGFVKGAARIPMDEIPERRDEIPTDGRPIVVYCAAGGRSAAVCEHLSTEGVQNLHNLEGGFGAWTGATETPSA